jgi:SAM-dependent methyltransferase
LSRSEYLFENDAPEAGDRFDALASLFDRTSIDHLQRLPLADGWRCLDVGAGGGSVAAWLAAHVGTSGQVVATDLDVRWLKQRLRAPNVDIRQHDIVNEPLPERSFDLIHERLVLIHLRQRVEVIGHLVSALRPGGWLLVEDFDSEIVSNAFIEMDSADDDMGRRIVRSVAELLAERGVDRGLGHKLPHLLREAGLIEVGADAYQVIDGGDAMRDLLRANIAQMADQIVDRKMIARNELDQYLKLLDEGAVNPSSPSLVSAWGQRPTE